MSATRLSRFKLGLAALSAVCSLASQTVHAGSAVVPFKASMTTQETLGFNPVACPNTVLQGTTVASGTASHMGSVSLISTDCIAQASAQFTFTDGQFVLTAANGDQLTATYSGMLLPSADYPVYTLSGSYTVTGGTGRFSGATGSGILQGSTNIGTGQGSYTASGVIHY